MAAIVDQNKSEKEKTMPMHAQWIPSTVNQGA
jgi:hypothetical protein